uniref:Glyoxalase/fosfomycin resistance/dioxygenase domain-containing protein n=1 Tax=Corethron hystrix TaxID=216773 RepID=A0A7S1BJJ5_9STRA|mmetsp:Transcript_28696/g.65569  ORF Transcript_28696/g.65569 Transcript_28696/m.65569 type:complete len:363 (+) Transcript_28696:117-1205(+)
MLYCHLQSWILLISLAGILATQSLSLSMSTIDTHRSLGATALRRHVLETGRKSAENTVDLPGVVWLEHINLVVGSKAQAEAFYCDFLGFTVDSGTSFHRNLGQQQVHLAANSEHPQRITGSVGLVVPSLETLRSRVPAAMAALIGTLFGVDKDDAEEGYMTIVGPWGNIMHLYDLDLDNRQKPLSEDPRKMVKNHAEGGSYSASRMAVRGQPGIKYVEVACKPGTVPAIARFYEEMIGCTVTRVSEDKAIIDMGPGVHLAYVESRGLCHDDWQGMEGVHLCIYVNDFGGLYRRLANRDLVWTNQRFVHLDTCDTWEDAAASRTLRFKDIIDLETGEKLLELEHETRPLTHGQFMKVPRYQPV